MAEATRSTIQKRDKSGAIRHGGEWLSIWSDPDSLKTTAELRSQDRARARFGEVRETIAAATRAVAGDPELAVRFADMPAIGPGQVVLVGPAPDLSDIAAARGEGDGAAALLRFSDRALHATLRPDEDRAARLFDLTEAVRCEACAARLYPALPDNLAAYQTARLSKSQLLHAHLAALIPLAEGLRMTLRDTLTGAAECSIQTGGLRMWSQWLIARHAETFARMKAQIGDQLGYSEAALSLGQALLRDLPTMGRALQRPERDPEGNLGNLSEAAPDQTSVGAAEWSEDEGGVALFDDLPEALRPEAAPAPAPAPRQPYRPFTQRHDRILQADDLTGRTEQRALRTKVIEKRGDMRRQLARLAAQLQKRLMAQRVHEWTFNLDEGLIDASKLERIVTDPGFDHVYKQEASAPVRDTVVTLLIDNSGSMRGKPIEIAALTAELLSEALERSGIANEVLGFTTAAWKGGQSFRDWVAGGRPAEPGRLNDLLHIVYKPANVPLTQARSGLFAMLSPGVLKENIDGEALRWAAERLMQRPEARRILIVISDGAPADEATLEQNANTDILHDDLVETIRALTRTPAIELSAIGVSHDVGAYYPRAIRIDRADDLGEVLIAQIDRLLTGQSGVLPHSGASPASGARPKSR